MCNFRIRLTEHVVEKGEAIKIARQRFFCSSINGCVEKKEKKRIIGK